MGKMDNTKKVLLIINPCAGRKKSKSGTFDIVDVFSHIGFDFIIKTTTCVGDAANIVRKFHDECDIVVCCGGDGTLNETINGVMGLERRLPIGYIPTGSTNDLALTMGIPVNIKKATDVIVSGHMNSLDVGLFNNRYFCYVASFGVATEIAYSTPQKMKNLLGHAAYIIDGGLLHIVSVLKNIKPIPMSIEYDNGTLEDDFYFGAISNSVSVGGLFRYDMNSVKLNDGLFEIILVRGMKHATDAFELLKKVKMKDYNDDRLILLKTENARIISEQAVPWTLDGEFGGKHKDIRFAVNSQAIDICSPKSIIFNAK